MQSLILHQIGTKAFAQQTVSLGLSLCLGKNGLSFTFGNSLLAASLTFGLSHGLVSLGTNLLDLQLALGSLLLLLNDVIDAILNAGIKTQLVGKRNVVNDPPLTHSAIDLLGHSIKKLATLLTNNVHRIVGGGNTAQSITHLVAKITMHNHIRLGTELHKNERHLLHLELAAHAHIGSDGNTTLGVEADAFVHWATFMRTGAPDDILLERRIFVHTGQTRHIHHPAGLERIILNALGTTSLVDLDTHPTGFNSVAPREQRTHGNKRTNHNRLNELIHTFSIFVV